MLTLLKRVFPSKNDRIIKRLKSTVEVINNLEPTFEALSDQQLQDKTQEFKQRYESGVSLDDLLPEAFANVREAAKRILGQRHYDVQLIAGMVLHHGQISEALTGEGKTLGSTLAVYLNALTGKGVHVITVNAYLAKRDAEWMGKVYAALGLSTGVVVPNISQEERKQAYLCDITYGTNNEFGFDYLRDHMAVSLDHMVQRKHSYAIVDEVDSILIDEARTPLIISGVAEGSTDIYNQIDALVKTLKLTEDFTIQEKEKRAYLTEEGHLKIEEMLRGAKILGSEAGLYDSVNLDLLYYCNAALKANFILQKDVDYIVKDGKVVIIDENTGRAMDGRRWSEGLHQATEAKEAVEIQKENQTMASITLQNYFLLYDKLAGMTGTADTEAKEFKEIYGLSVLAIPTNRPMIREDKPDSIYLTEESKYKAIVKDVLKCYEVGQPVLVGTTSIESSEKLSKELKKNKIPHQVLNAKFHEKEALIIAQAGCIKAVTIATNMAGRGTDIVLGGNFDAYVEALDKPLGDAEAELLKKRFDKEHKEVLALGGLHVLGSERHDSRRIDNQLRGRSGRQGDPGSSQFFISLEDTLMRVFAAGKTQNIMRMAGMKDSDKLEHSLLNRSVENAQKKMEGYHFDIRKQLLRFDNIANEQRKMIYQQRDELMTHDEISDVIQSMLSKTIYRFFSRPFEYNGVMHRAVLIEDFNIGDGSCLQALIERLKHEYLIEQDKQAWLTNKTTVEQAASEVCQAIKDKLIAKASKVGESIMNKVEKVVVLDTLDHCWREHLRTMDHLRQNIHLRGYAQKNPYDEYRREALALFEEMLFQVQDMSVHKLCRLEFTEDTQLKPKPAPQVALNRSEPDNVITSWSSGEKKIGRNEPCSCGSGKKYKHCCG